MNKRNLPQERRPVPGAEKANLNRMKPKSRVIVVSVILIVVLVAAVSAWAQSFNLSLVGGDNAEIACDGRGVQVQRLSRTAVNVVCSGPSSDPQPTPSAEPTNPPAPTATSPAPEPTVQPCSRATCFAPHPSRWRARNYRPMRTSPAICW